MSHETGISWDWPSGWSVWSWPSSLSSPSTFSSSSSSSCPLRRRSRGWDRKRCCVKSACGRWGAREHQQPYQFLCARAK
eukprot:796545-Pyramimonas_sp.AAC.1